jgi:DNA mismatch repair protein MutL
MKIHVLSDDLISQIAAGEVIERPASALKELLENSLDAGASRVVVELEAGGLKQIRVSDDGRGIPAADVPLAFTRHATSKIDKVEDLFELNSLGFRGEALAAIASVSRVLLSTRNEDERVGTRMEVDGGKVLSLEETAHESGTDIRIYGLFKHTPARKKYMKSERTEYGHCFELVSHTALAHPHVGFILKRDGKVIFDLAGMSGSGHSSENGEILKERIRQLYGSETAKALIPVHYGDGEMRPGSLTVRGFVGKPELARSSRKYQFLFVNHRPIENRSLNHAVREAFHSLLMHEKHPWYILDIEIDPSLVDVNVHPRKKEVKFVNPQDVYRAVKGCIHHALEKAVLSPVMEAPARHGGGVDNFGGGNFAGKMARDLSEQFRFRAGSSFGITGLPDEAELQGSQLDLEGSASFSGGKNWREQERPPARVFQLRGLSLRPLAQLAHSYILAESEEGLVLIDQHAAHERVRYAQLMQELDKESPRKQPLLTPAELDVGADGARLLEAHLEDFSAMGYEMEAFGGTSYLMRTVPVGLENRDPQAVFQDILGDLERVGFKPGIAGKKSTEGSNAGKDLREHLLTYTACRSAVKFGDPLSIPEMEALLVQMDETQHCTHCPHGRPAVITFTYNKLETLFKRRNF